ncbi:MAG: hypothetical protein V3T86_14095 [Planctomycetota bacterium]
MVLPVCGWLIWTAVLRAEFESRVQALRDAGHPADLADLMEKPVLDENNAAVLYAKAAPMIGEFPCGLESKRYGDELYPGELEEAARWLESKSGVVALLHEAAARPSCVLDIDWTKGIDAEIEFGSWSHDFSFLLEEYAEKKAQEGEVQEATRCVETIFRIANHTPPACTSLFWQRVGRNVTAMQVLRKISTADAFDPAAARTRFDPYIALALDREPLTTALRCDLALSLSLSRAWIRGGSPIPFLERMSFDNVLNETPDEVRSSRKVMGWFASTWVMRPFAIRDGIYLIEDFEYITELLATEDLSDLESRARVKRGLPYVFASVATPNVVTFGAWLRDVRAHVAITRAGLDALISRKNTGHFPADLTGSPLDPFTDKLLRYERHEDGTARIEAAVPIEEWQDREEHEIAWELK